MKKGFTLVELSIVLVVIGLLFGMVMKGKSILDSAQMRSELAGITKISNAVNTYVTKYDRRPVPAGVVATSESVFQLLMKQDLLNEADNRTPGGNHWVFIGCTPENDYYKLDTIKSNNKLCLYRATSAIGTIDLANSQMDSLFVCNIETMLDDQNIKTGKGRQAGTNNAINAAATGLDEMDCNNINDKTLVRYVYLIK